MTKKTIRKLLIANRGEIACRIISTCQKLGIGTVALYSAADGNSKHVAMADEAYYVGPAPSKESYLQVDKVIEIAHQSGADAIHPGYGFLSENAGFARRCEQEGIIFVGPSADAIEAMGSKSAAKALMVKAEVPVVPGYHGDEQDPDTLVKQAKACGFPLLIKASAGGGGKGMRVVEDESQLSEAIDTARREALSSFGDDHLLMERYLAQPRHVEVQVFCDQQGNGIYLGDRDCSIQRRHQKVVEEAPAPGLSDATRKAMGEAAVRAAQAIDYHGAGTIEFLYDTDGQFYFMEMNTRLQVEHPVTEKICRQDLVEWQLRIAAGDKLPLQQSELELRGHAVEVRIYAEDPDMGFLPSTGTLQWLKEPETSAQVRVDSGIRMGDEVSPYYDPMIAKLICFGDDRQQAIHHLSQALENYQLIGVHHNTGFLHQVINHPAFIDADLDTSFIDKHELLEKRQQQGTPAELLAAAACWFHECTPTALGLEAGWRLNAAAQQHIKLEHDGEALTFTLTRTAEGLKVQHGDNTLVADITTTDDSIALVTQQGRHFFQLHCEDDVLTLFNNGDSYSFHEWRALEDGADHQPEGSLAAPMNGVIVDVPVAVDDTVKAGDLLLVMEAMKMEYSVRAPADGCVEAIHFQPGDLVNEGDLLIAVTETE